MLAKEIKTGDKLFLNMADSPADEPNYYEIVVEHAMEMNGTMYIFPVGHSFLRFTPDFEFDQRWSK